MSSWRMVVVKAGDKIVKGTAYAFLFEVNQDTNPDFLKKIVAVKWDEKQANGRMLSIKTS